MNNNEACLYTNEIDVSIDYAKLDDEYDFFKIRHNERDSYVPYNNFFSDNILLSAKESGVYSHIGVRYAPYYQKDDTVCYIMMKKSDDNHQWIRNELDKSIDDDENKRFACAILSAYDFREPKMKNVLIQLMLNALCSSEYENINTYSNITGALIYFDDTHIKKEKIEKRDVITQIHAINVIVTLNGRIELLVKTYSNIILKDKIFSEKKMYIFNKLPQYVIDNNLTIRRANSNDTGEKFVNRALWGEKYSKYKAYINKYDSFNTSKVGVLSNILYKFNNTYRNIAEITLKCVPQGQYKEIPYSGKEKINNEKFIKNSAKNMVLNIVDKVNTDTSAKIVSYILDEEKWAKKASNPTIGVKEITVSDDICPGALNIMLIYPTNYYKKHNLPDPYDVYPNAAVQHYTVSESNPILTMDDKKKEAFHKDVNNRIRKCFYECMIKNDLINGKISMFDWKAMNLSHPMKFALGYSEKKSKYQRKYSQHFFSIMTIYPDGSFDFSDNNDEIGILTDSEAFINKIERIYKKNYEPYTRIKGIVIYKDNINLIVDDNLKLMPNIVSIDKRIYDEDEQGDFILSKAKDSWMLNSNIDVKYVGIDINSEYSGRFGVGLSKNIDFSANIDCQKFVHFNKLVVHSGRLLLDEIIPLLSVCFIRVNRFTVIPFPFKYLREHLENRSRTEYTELYRLSSKLDDKDDNDITDYENSELSSAEQLELHFYD